MAAHGNRTAGLVITIAAVVVALLAIGLFTDWFGLYHSEMVPGATIPPTSPG